MLITNITTISFHPLREYKAIIDFETRPDIKEWEKSESTVLTSYTKIERVAVTLKEEEG